MSLFCFRQCSDSNCKGNRSKILRFESFPLLGHLSHGHLFILYLRNACSRWRKLNIKTVGEKFKALRDLESGLSNKDVTIKNINYPKTQFQLGLKSKKNIFLHWNNLRIKEKNWDRAITNKIT